MSQSAIDDARVATRLAAIQAALGPALDAKVAALGTQLKQRIEAKLSGGALATKSGALLASITTEPENEGDTALIHVASHGVPYARIQEFGGKTAAHDIVAVKAEALAFVAGGKSVVAKSVHHPGSRIPPHFYMHGALDEMRDEIVGALKQAIGAAIDAA